MVPAAPVPAAPVPAAAGRVVGCIGHGLHGNARPTSSPRSPATHAFAGRSAVHARQRFVEEHVARCRLIEHDDLAEFDPDPAQRGEPDQFRARQAEPEAGLRPRLLERPAAAAVRSFGEGLPVGLSLSYAAIGDPEQPLVAEDGQPGRAWRCDLALTRSPWARPTPEARPPSLPRSGRDVRKYVDPSSLPIRVKAAA
jgi:hypothetical protein